MNKLWEFMRNMRRNRSELVCLSDNNVWLNKILPAVPREFPDSSFHIWMDDATDEKLCNKFMDKFRAIVGF